ncbi:hypothetical protein V6N13_021455 [Hibiscus sabdariffa]|uniref:Uncharacterized protein n=2 Tax=Hibiscus sabdariffa TaxID=183260 RepID=A0ABR2AIS1_9ROSI
MDSTTSGGDRSEICFFDLETTVPRRRGQGFSILEFGAILICPKRLLELKSFASLVRPDDLSSISPDSVRCNGISRDDVAKAPSFSEIADRVHDILHGRVWAGHNIVKFDCVRIREAFEKIGRPAPEPKGIIDSLVLLSQRFGKRAGNMKMDTLSKYFELGKQKHRSLDDVRMNLEVLKYCATVLFLESSLPDILTPDIFVSPGPTTRSSSKSKLSFETPNSDMHTLSPSSSSENDPILSSTARSSSNSKSSFETPNSDIRTLSSCSSSEDDPTLSPTDLEDGEQHPIISLLACHTGEVNSYLTTPAQSDPFDMTQLKNEIKTEALKLDVTEEKPELRSPDVSPATAVVEGCSGYAGFLEPDEVSITSISASSVPQYRGTHQIKLLHKNVALQLFCPRLTVRSGISKKFLDQAGRPRLSFVVDASPTLCGILDACDAAANEIFVDCGSNSDWRHVVIRNYNYISTPTARLRIPTIVNGDTAQYGTEIHRKDYSGNVQKLVFDKFNADELSNIIQTGISVDAFFSLDTFDYQQIAGIRLVAKNFELGEPEPPDASVFSSVCSSFKDSGMVENNRILESLLFEWENYHSVDHRKQKQPPQTKPNSQIKQQWSMVMIRDSVPHSDLSVFPPANHENLHRQIQQPQQNPPSDLTLLPPPDAGDVVSSSGGRGIGRWLGVGVGILRAKIVGLACYFGYKNGTIGRAFRSFRGVIDLATVVLLWWLCKRIWRLRRRKESAERLRMIIKEKDEKIVGLLNQIAEMNKVLVERHKLVASKPTH